MPDPNRIEDPALPQDGQYRDDANLAARITLHQRFSTNPDGWMRWVYDHLAPLQADASILEIGCGTGALWLENRDRLLATWQLTLTDLSPGMLTTAVRSVRSPVVRVAFAVADAQAIPFAAGSFDAVIANHMLYHVPDRRRALREIRRVLRPPLRRDQRPAPPARA